VGGGRAPSRVAGVSARTECRAIWVAHTGQGLCNERRRGAGTHALFLHSTFGSSSLPWGQKEMHKS